MALQSPCDRFSTWRDISIMVNLWYYSANPIGNIVDLVIFTCLNFREFVILELEFESFQFGFFLCRN